MTHDNFTTLLVAFIGLMPWAMGLWLDHKRRMEKAERERQHKPRHHIEPKTKAGDAHHPDEHGKSRIGRGTGDGGD